MNTISKATFFFVANKIKVALYNKIDRDKRLTICRIYLTAKNAEILYRTMKEVINYGNDD